MSSKTVHSIGIIMNGVTGRMGVNQHLRRSILEIMAQGGVKISDSVTIMPRPLLVGRNSAKLEALAQESGGLPWTTDLAVALEDPAYSIYFDAQTTDRRVDAVRQAIAAGKHIYCEKPSADSLQGARELYELAKKAGVKHGVVQDKLWLPGLVETQNAARSRILRSHIFSPRRIRLLGLRGRHHSRPAALLELSPGRRRRPHHGYALPLALCPG